MCTITNLAESEVIDRKTCTSHEASSFEPNLSELVPSFPSRPGTQSMSWVGNPTFCIRSRVFSGLSFPHLQIINRKFVKSWNREAYAKIQYFELRIRKNMGGQPHILYQKSGIQWPLFSPSANYKQKIREIVKQSLKLSTYSELRIRENMGGQSHICIRSRVFRGLSFPHLQIANRKFVNSWNREAMLWTCHGWAIPHFVSEFGYSAVSIFIKK